MDLSKKETTTKDSPPSQPGNTTTLIKQSGLLDDFKNCIEGFDETAATNGYADVYSKVEELKRNVKAGRDGDAINGLAKKDETPFQQEVTRYNILDGTIMHCHEQTYSQTGRQAGSEQKLATAACSSQNEGPFLRSLLQKKSGESGDGETSSVGSPSQAADADSQEKHYPCKVCKKKYMSKSSLRKHFCFPNSDDGANQQPPQGDDVAMQRAPQQLPAVKIKQEIPEGQIPNGIAPSQPMPTFFVKSENGAAAPVPPPPAMMGEQQFVVPAPPGEEGEETFSCPVCNMQFKHSSHLMRHRRTHTNERPFECTDCHQAFRRKCHLKRHWQRIHSGEKPFKCAICGKAFSDRDHQRQHETIHGPETYPCFR